MLTRRSLLVAVAAAPLAACRAPEERLWIRSYMEKLGLQSKIDHIRKKKGLDVLHAIQSLGNSLLMYESDMNVYGKNEYWATPAEALSHSKGDCDDYTVLKWAIAYSLGIYNVSFVTADCKVSGVTSGHITLAMYFKGDMFVLDNNGPITRRLTPGCSEAIRFGADDEISAVRPSYSGLVLQIRNVIDRMRAGL